MDFYHTFADYHYRRTLRKEKIKFLFIAIGTAILGTCLILLCAFIGTTF